MSTPPPDDTTTFHPLKPRAEPGSAGEAPDLPPEASPDTPSVFEAPPLPAERITRDLACFGCGYNLRTMPLDAACPECGLAVRDSVRPYIVDPADVATYRRWQRGVRQLSISLVMIAAMPGVWILAGIAEVFLTSLFVMPVLLNIYIIAEHLLWYRGIVKATIASSSAPDVDALLSVRRSSRRAAGINALLMGLVLVMPWLAVLSMYRWSEIIGFAVLLLIFIVFITRMVAVHFIAAYLGRVLDGFGRPAEARRLRRRARAGVFALGALTSGYVFTWVLLSSGGFGGLDSLYPVVAASIIIILSTIALMALSAITAVVLWRLPRKLPKLARS